REMRCFGLMQGGGEFRSHSASDFSEPTWRAGDVEKNYDKVARTHTHTHTHTHTTPSLPEGSILTHTHTHTHTHTYLPARGHHSHTHLPARGQHSLSHTHTHT